MSEKETKREMKREMKREANEHEKGRGVYEVVVAWRPENDVSD